ncbi:MAG: TonB-dependent receptor plug domain-containing protein [Bacteroidales bacterium]
MRQKFKFSRRMVHFRQWANKKYAVFNSMHRVIKICTLALAYSLVTSPKQGKAQEVDTTQSKVTAIDEVTVQASLLELKSAEMGRQIEVITVSQLQMAPVSSLDELLRFLPNIETQSRGAFGTQADFSLRGANFSQMLVLIDGHKINDPVTGHFNSNIPIATSEIERIEVIYGPASSEFGPDAMGGVVNIVTKTFTRKSTSKQFSTTGKVLYGEHNLISADPGVFQSWDKLAVSAGVLFNKSDGNPLASGRKNYFNNQTYSGSLAYQLSPKIFVAYRYGYDFRDFNAQWYYSTSRADSAFEKVVRNRHQLQLVHEAGIHKTMLSGSYLTTDDKFVFNSRSMANNSTSFGLARLTHQIAFSEQFNVLVGTEYNQRAIESNNRGNHNLWHGAAFLLASYKPISQLVVNPSMRADYDEWNKFYWLPQISVSYAVSKQAIVRAAAGKALRVPDYTELYYNNFVAFVNPNNRLGNPQLKAESAWNYEVGTDIRILPSLWFSTTLFYRQTQNQIDYIAVNSSTITDLTNLVPDTTYWRAFNNSKVNTLGVDARLTYQWRLASFVQSQFTIGYSYTDIDVNSNARPLYLLLHSKHLLSASLSLKLYQALLNLTGNYRVRESSQYVASIDRYLKKSYAVWNAALDYPVLKNNLYVNLSVHNLFDMQYSDFLGAEMPGRWIAGGIKFNF